MITDQEIMDGLAELAKRRGTTKAKVLRDALLAEWKRVGEADDALFPREKVSYRGRLDL